MFISEQFTETWTPRMLSVLRVVVALLYMEHGTSKLLNFPPSPMFGHLPTLLLVAAILEVGGGALLALGLFTRPAAFILSGEMAIGYFMAHFPKAFLPMVNGGEGAVFYCFTFLFFAVAGGGAWSLDALRKGGMVKTHVS